MKLEIKTNVTGLEELKELLESAKKQAVELEETLNKISETEISVEFEPKIYKGGNQCKKNKTNAQSKLATQK